MSKFGRWLRQWFWHYKEDDMLLYPYRKYHGAQKAMRRLVRQRKRVKE